MSPPSIKIADYRGFSVHLPKSGGKAGFGRNVTSSIQLRRYGMIEKQFRFVVADQASRSAAVAKAKAWVDEKLRKIYADS